MNLLPTELQLIIISQLPIPDKRNFIRCTKQLNMLKDEICIYEPQFLGIINNTLYLGTNINSLNDLEKYTLEYAYYGYANLIPQRYIIRRDNRILYNYGNFYFNTAKKNYTELIKILICYNDSYYVDITAGAAAGGNLEMLKWARKNGCNWNSQTCSRAAENGHLEVLKWARKNGCDWNSLTCARAAKNGHLEVLKWARKNGCDWDSWTCAYAAKNGHLEVLKWARENGCDWDRWTCAYTATNGHLEVLKWARENGCDWDRWTCAYAAINGQLEVLKWARENGCDWNSKLICVYASVNGHLEVLKWARKNGC